MDNEQAQVVRAIDADHFVIAGSTGSFGAGASDIYLFVVDGNGDLQWSRTIGQLGLDVATDLLVLPDGGFMISGYTTSDGAGGYDGLLVRTTADGAVQWQQTYGGADWDFLYDIRAIGADAFLLSGHTYSFGPVGGNAWLMEVNDSGVELWSDIPVVSAPSVGYAATPAADGGIVLVGAVSLGDGTEDVLVVKYDAFNVQEWSFSFGGVGDDIGRDIVQTMDGGYSVVGSTRSYSQWVEGYHLKIDPMGSEEWQYNWGQINDQEMFEHFQLTSGEFASIGYTRTSGGGGKDMFLLKSAEDGGFIYGRTFGGSDDDIGCGMALLVDGFICVGSTSSFGAGGTDVFLVRTDVEGMTQFETVENAFDPLSLGDPSELSLLLHPNPSTGTFSIPEQRIAGRWSLVDVSGRLRSEGAVAPGASLIEVDVPSGSYVLRITSTDGNITSARVTILRP